MVCIHYTSFSSMNLAKIQFCVFVYKCLGLVVMISWESTVQRCSMKNCSMYPCANKGSLTRKTCLRLPKIYSVGKPFPVRLVKVRITHQLHHPLNIWRNLSLTRALESSDHSTSRGVHCMCLCMHIDRDFYGWILSPHRGNYSQRFDRFQS